MYQKLLANTVFGVAMVALAGCAVTDAGDDQTTEQSATLGAKEIGRAHV